MTRYKDSRVCFPTDSFSPSVRTLLGQLIKNELKPTFRPTDITLHTVCIRVALILKLQICTLSLWKYPSFNGVAYLEQKPCHCPTGKKKTKLKNNCYQGENGQLIVILITVILPSPTRCHEKIHQQSPISFYKRSSHGNRWTHK